MTDLNNFINTHRGLLIAPAGHGKTTAIADCLLQCPEKSCQLILTHTHAGIASLRTKFKKKNIPSTRYHLETITGFAQRYVIGFLGTSVLPDEADKSYFNTAIELCKKLMRSKLVQTIIKTSYNGIFVDEYQDCTIDQHEMIMCLAQGHPLHLFGDPLQGIFSFEAKPLVDFDKDLVQFTRFNSLVTPWRWQENNPELGQEILRIRKSLESKNKITLANNPKIGFHVVPVSKNEYDNYNILAAQIKKHDNNSLLIICPIYKELSKNGVSVLKGKLTDRIKIKQMVDFKNEFTIIDAFDANTDYSLASIIDTYLDNCKKNRRINRIARFYDILDRLHLKMSEINKWINKKENRFIKRGKGNASNYNAIIEKFSCFEKDPTLTKLQDLIMSVALLPKVKHYHRELDLQLKQCFNVAQTNNMSMLTAMKTIKSRMRHQGRKIDRKCIGTTLLTKGLEFDTVIIWNAHKFEDAKNFYVAISRACKEIILLTNKNEIEFK